MLECFRSSRKLWLNPGVQPGEVNQVESIIGGITRLHAILVREPDLRPCGRINSLFEELVSICSQTLSQDNVLRARQFSVVNNNY